MIVNNISKTITNLKYIKGNKNEIFSLNLIVRVYSVKYLFLILEIIKEFNILI